MSSEPEHPDRVPMADPGKKGSRWLQEFWEALDDIARGVENVIWFDPENERQTAEFLDSNQSDQPGVPEFLRRFEIRLLHGKTGAERQAIQRRAKRLTRKRMTGQEYLEATCLELAEYWPATIDRATDLWKRVTDEKDSILGLPPIAEAEDVIREAMVCLLTIHDEGSALRNRWGQTLEITEFDDKDTIEEFFDDAAGFSENLRQQNVASRLDAVADDLRVRLLLAPTGHPSDFITLPVAVHRYTVSRSTLRRAVKDRRLRDYRPTDHVSNAALVLREAEIALCWPRRS